MGQNSGTILHDITAKIGMCAMNYALVFHYSTYVVLFFALIQIPLIITNSTSYQALAISIILYRYFERQLQLCEKTGLPLFLHCRNAFDDFIGDFH